MQKINWLQDKWRNAVFFLIGFLIVDADQLSKTWIRANLISGQSICDIGFLRITRVHNTGAAFGLFQDQSFALIIIAFIGITAILLCAIFSHRYLPFLDNMLGKSALGLILGGTVGNLIDRLRFGYVTDFIDFGIWPAFNIADSAVTIGVIIFAYSILCLARTSQR